MTGGRILVSLKDSRPLLYKCSFNGYHNAGCGYYILFIIFGIITFIGCCRVWVLYISLAKVFIRMLLYSLDENYKSKNLLAKEENVLTFLSLAFFKL